MAPNQFSFRKGVSTESAVDTVLKIAARAAAIDGPTKDLCVLITLDVMNAFNTLRWPVIDKALRRKGTPEYLVQMLRSWLSDRDLLVGDAGASKSVTCGVPQGSVLGQILWNTVYDQLLIMLVPVGLHLVGFTNDLAVVGTARSGPMLKELINPVLERIDAWMSTKEVLLAHHKSEAVMLIKRWTYTKPIFRIGDHTINFVPHLRYLGVLSTLEVLL